MEDFVTWVDTSKLKRHVQKYNVRSFALRRVPPSPFAHVAELSAGRTGRLRPHVASSALLSVLYAHFRKTFRAPPGLFEVAPGRTPLSSRATVCASSPGRALGVVPVTHLVPRPQRSLSRLHICFLFENGVGGSPTKCAPASIASSSPTKRNADSFSFSNHSSLFSSPSLFSARPST